MCHLKVPYFGADLLVTLQALARLAHDAMNMKTECNAPKPTQEKLEARVS